MTGGGASLLIDVGSTAIKGVVLRRADGSVLTETIVPTPALREIGGRREFDAAELVAAVRAAATSLIRASDQAPDEMLLSTQMHTAVLTDAVGVPLSPMISWQDNRLLERDRAGVTRLERLVEDGAESWPASGMAHRPGFGAGNLGAWLRENPDQAARPGRVHTVGSFVATALGAPFATHVTNAASLGLLDVGTRTWSPALQELHALEGWELPGLREGHEPEGTIRLEGVDLRWLGDIADHQASVLGSGGLRDGDLAISLGTAGIAARLASRPSTDPRVDSRPYGRGEFLLTVSRQPGGAVAAVFAQMLAELASDLAEVPVDAHTVWERTAAWRMREGSRSWVRFDVTPDGRPELGFGGVDPSGDVLGELYGAFVRAYIDAYRECVEILFPEEAPPGRVRFNGGFAARNASFRRALSEGLGLEMTDVPPGDLALEGLRRIVAGSDRMEKVG